MIARVSRRLPQNIGVAEKVRFAGRVTPEELPDHFRLADVFVMPSTGEGFGIVFLEAMASGIHVIGGNQDGSLDPLADGMPAAADRSRRTARRSPPRSRRAAQSRRSPGARRRFHEQAFRAHVRH